MAATRKAATDVPTATVGDFWEVPEGSVITGPFGTHTVVGGRFCLQVAGTYTTDSGDSITVV